MVAAAAAAGAEAAHAAEDLDEIEAIAAQLSAAHVLGVEVTDSNNFTSV
jgi:NADP-dependent 3-hydroxy acid dehydrogenase YdfG